MLSSQRRSGPWKARAVQNWQDTQPTRMGAFCTGAVDGITEERLRDVGSPQGSRIHCDSSSDELNNSESKEPTVSFDSNNRENDVQLHSREFLHLVVVLSLSRGTMSMQEPRVHAVL